MVYGPMLKMKEIDPFLFEGQDPYPLTAGPQCHVSILRKGFVPCHYILNPQVVCHMSNLRNVHVALSIQGPSYWLIYIGTFF